MFTRPFYPHIHSNGGRTLIQRLIQIHVIMQESPALLHQDLHWTAMIKYQRLQMKQNQNKETQRNV